VRLRIEKAPPSSLDKLAFNFSIKKQKQFLKLLPIFYPSVELKPHFSIFNH